MNKFVGKAGELFVLRDLNNLNQGESIRGEDGELSLLWFISDGNRISIDSKEYEVNSFTLICFTDFHHINAIELHSAKLLRWNRPFYCLLNHDSDIGCKGILFYGATTLPIINLEENDTYFLATAWKMLELEMESIDSLKQEMLQMMLKRILTLCTRLFKSQKSVIHIEKASYDIIREFNFLVENNFKSKHTVAEYAEILSKSPKTLSNLFKKLGSKSPLQYIQERRYLEARRLLAYSEDTVSEIGYSLGFADVQSFSRFFKKHGGQPPQEFRKFFTREN